MVGKDIRVKALVGLSAIRADANERDAPAEDRWYEEVNIPKSSEASSKLQPVWKGHASTSNELTLASESV